MTIPSDVLRRLILTVAPAAGKDESRMALTTVRFGYDPDRKVLSAAATDSYRIHKAEHLLAGEDPLTLPAKAWAAHVPATWLRRWAVDRYLVPAPRKHKWDHARMVPAPVVIDVTQARFSLTVGADSRTIGQPSDLTYPNLEKLLTDYTNNDTATEAAFNPKLIGDLVRCAAAWHKTAPIRTERWDVLGPCRFTAKASHGVFTAMLMPVRAL